MNSELETWLLDIDSMRHPMMQLAVIVIVVVVVVVLVVVCAAVCLLCKWQMRINATTTQQRNKCAWQMLMTSPPDSRTAY